MPSQQVHKVVGIPGQTDSEGVGVGVGGAGQTDILAVRAVADVRDRSACRDGTGWLTTHTVP